MVIRKNDSTMSILLFIYNNYSTLTGRDSLRVSSLLDAMAAFGKNETALRMTLTRAIRANLLARERGGNEISYVLAPEGKAAVSLWNADVAEFWRRYRSRGKKWDGKWNILRIGSSKGDRAGRSTLYEKLRRLGFGQIDSNLWISPYRIRDNVFLLLDECGMRDSAVEIRGGMRINVDMPAFLNRVFGLEGLRAFYLGFLREHGDASDYAAALPGLHELGWSFFNEAASDPLLPRELLPIWEGEEAGRVVRVRREILVKSASSYLRKLR